MLDGYAVLEDMSEETGDAPQQHIQDMSIEEMELTQ
jgi:hypothetical protein